MARLLYYTTLWSIQRDRFWIRRYPNKSSKLRRRFAIRSIVTHVFSGRRKTSRDRWRTQRATLNEKSDHWSLPPFPSEELFGAIRKHFWRLASEMLKRSCFYRICLHVSLPCTLCFSPSELRHLYLIITFSVYHLEPTNAFFSLLLAITALFCRHHFLSSFEKIRVANFAKIAIRDELQSEIKRNNVFLQ